MSQRRRRASPATIFFALLSLLLAAALWFKSCPPGGTPQLSRVTPAGGGSRARPTARPPVKTPRPPEHARLEATPPGRETPGVPRVAIVIDDLGNELAPAQRIAGWPWAVAGAVLPQLRWSVDSAGVLSRGGKEVLLHLPMEPEGYPRVRPGPGVILRSQSDAEIVRVLESDLETVPGASGVNNHMGSAATADPRVMKAVTRVLAGRNLFFLDSRTTDATVAERTAEESSVKAVSRRVFLDDVATDAAVTEQLQILWRRARQEQSAVAIGHPYAVTLSVLERELPRMGEQGVRLVRVGELVR